MLFQQAPESLVWSRGGPLRSAQDGGRGRSSWWVYAALWCVLGLTCGSSALFLAVSVDCNVVLASPVTGCPDSHLSPLVAGRVSPLLQYGLHLTLALVFVRMSRGLLVSPRAHIKRVYNTRGRHLPELLVWLCTGAAITDRVLAVGVEDSLYDVMAVASVSLVLNTLCLSIAADMNLSAEDDEERDDDFDDVEYARMRSERYFLHGEGRSSVRHPSEVRALLILVACFFVHNAVMFLGDASYFVALLEQDPRTLNGEGSGHTLGSRTSVRRLLLLLGIFVMWYRASQAVFWYRKYNFPHANVMLPRYDGAILRNRPFLVQTAENTGME